MESKPEPEIVLTTNLFTSDFKSLNC